MSPPLRTHSCRKPRTYTTFVILPVAILRLSAVVLALING